MTQQETNTAKDLMYGWNKGWPEYIPNDKSDHPAILRLSITCAKIAQVSIEEEEGYMRIKNGLASIAAFCRDSIKWKGETLFGIELKYQEVLQEMNAWRKAKKADQDKISEQHNNYNEQVKKRLEQEKLAEKSRIESLRWAIKNWDYIWEWSERIAKESKFSRCLSYEKSKEELSKIPSGIIEELKKDVEEMKERWRNDFAKSTTEIL